MSERSTEYQGPLAIDLAEIDDNKRPASEMRVGLDIEAVKEYAHVLADLPPIKLMWDRKAEQYWVVDGAHTLTAFAGTGQRIVQAMVADGNYLQAFRAACNENVRRGVRITNADKRRRVDNACRALAEMHDEWPWAAKRLGDFSGVGHDLADAVLTDFMARTGQDATAPRTGSDGKRRRTKRSPARIAAPGVNGHVTTGQLAENASSSVAAPAPAAPPDRYAGLKKVLAEIRILMATVDAADTPEDGGWGGFPAVWQALSPWEQQDVRSSLDDLVDCLGEWQLFISTGRSDEGSHQPV